MQETQARVSWSLMHFADFPTCWRERVVVERLQSWPCRGVRGLSFREKGCGAAGQRAESCLVFWKCRFLFLIPALLHRHW